MPLDKVYELGSSVALVGCAETDLDGGGSEGVAGSVAGVDCFKGEEKAGVGGVGAAEELDSFPKALRAACIATD